ncbi:DgyrCDS4776 [Dimorphilus gyrociliatus]|uniref:DgyrCDS4776 n=1 Tax=Dimorphilus gyrociliatus TaxID=2664684 RepID=A0A7I8VIH2_9ANNE|nr:DgyrCDS4776 [Dimorphilus gyrociliatus]
MSRLIIFSLLIVACSAAFNQEYFLRHIFEKYGNGTNMPFEGFEHLLQALGLGNVTLEHDLVDHKKAGGFHEFHPSHEHSYSGNPTLKDKNGHDHEHDHDHHLDNEHDNIATNELEGNKRKTSSSHSHVHGKKKLENSKTDSQNNKSKEGTSPQEENDIKDEEILSNRQKRTIQSNKCLRPDELLLLVKNRKKTINKSEFLKVCPVLVAQIDDHACIEQQRRYQEAQNVVIISKKAFDFSRIPLKVWGCALLSVFVISMVGLLGVAAVPLMKSRIYDHLLSFLVALAIGSLTGDALLHLIPHALSGGHAEGDDHSHADKSGVFKGLVALAGLYTFFIAERLLSILNRYQRKRRSRKAKMLTIDSPRVARRLCTHHSRYSYILTDEELSKKLRDESTDVDVECDHDVNEMDDLSPGASAATPYSYEKDTSSKGHGHSHDVPDSMGAVAWMVIFGDGLHNFSDGLAIGAAFAAGIGGGVSTAVAVLCHELPHELGDFAVLLKAGMTVKRALLYNILSSILCLMGMVIGVGLGNVDTASSWIFSLAAGMFIYIALADMMPHLNSGKTSHPTMFALILHIGGITTGAGIMLLIALFEDKIQLSLGD